MNFTQENEGKLRKRQEGRKRESLECYTPVGVNDQICVYVLSVSSYRCQAICLLD